jgi:hypothetical protein
MHLLVSLLLICACCLLLVGGLFSVLRDMLQRDLLASRVRNAGIAADAESPGATPGAQSR